MGLSYDSALLTSAQLVNYTSQTDLASLESDSELDLDTVILDAQREIYERLHGNGLSVANLAALTNQAWLSRHVADLTLARVEETHLDRPDRADERRRRALEGVDRFKPIYATNTATSRRSGEGIPAVAHQSDGMVYGPRQVDALRGDDYVRTNLPVDLG